MWSFYCLIVEEEGGIHIDGEDSLANCNHWNY